MSGSRYERELVNYLDAKAYHVVRAPSSGGGTKRSLPDLFWSKADERSVAAELKTTSKTKAYYTAQEVTALKEFAAAFNAHARLVARFKGDTSYYVCAPRDLYRTNNGSYRVEKGDEIFTIDP